jgi:lactate racemase
MNPFRFKYGRKDIELNLPAYSGMDWIQPAIQTHLPDPSECVRQAIHQPISALFFPNIHADTSVAIAINDKTRPVSYDLLLPPLLEFLSGMGIHSNRIILYIASGTHLPMLEDEFQSILPDDIISHYKIVSHDCDNQDNLVCIGNTSTGTPVEVNKDFHNSDIKILVGNLEPHHFMGYSGGYKTASIGLTSRRTINHNHSLLVSDLACTGEFDRNPCRQDVEEIGKMIGVHLALNAIPITDKQIAHCLFGSPADVMRLGIPLSRALCQVQLTKKYDLVIASCGGYPKDINLYQAQKAITNSIAITRTGGTIILFAECEDGIGSDRFLKFMEDIHNPDQAIEKFLHQEFQIGPHKAFQLARQAKKAEIHLFSSLPDELVEHLFLSPGNLVTIQSILTMAQVNNLSIALMPNAVITIPDYSKVENASDRSDTF